MSDISNLKVYLDGEQLAYTSESQADSWRLSFSYHHSTHEVAINLGSAPANSSSQNLPWLWIINGAAIGAIVIAASFAAKRKRRSLK